jgi:cation-transporting ATPase 13A1
MLLCVFACCWTVSQIVQLTTFGVNYVGHPFNSGLMENAGMLRSLRYSSCFLALLVSQAIPPLNER